MDLIREKVAKHYKRINYPEFKTGDTLRVSVRIIEGEKTRTQIYEGVAIKIKGTGLGKTFTVRKISSGIGVERIFPYYSPSVESVEVVSRGFTRRGKLYFVRRLIGKAARIDRKKEAQIVVPKASAEPTAN